MLPLLIAGIAALAIVVIAVGIAMSGGGGGVSARLERYASGRDPTPMRRTESPSPPSSPASRASSSART